MKSAGGIFCRKLNFRICFNTGIVIVTIVYEYELRNGKRLGCLLSHTFYIADWLYGPLVRLIWTRSFRWKNVFCWAEDVYFKYFPKMRKCHGKNVAESFVKQNPFSTAQCTSITYRIVKNNELWVPSWTKI